jgi:hypothetical protein
MQARAWTVSAGVAAALALSATSHATIERSAAGGVETIECKGESVEVSGASYDLTLLGECPSVEVSGASNTVRVEAVRSIEVTGTGNKVIWERSLRGERPSIESTGLGNSVSQGTVAGARRGGASAVVSGKSAVVSSGGDTVGVEAGRKASGRRAAAVVISNNEQTRTIDCTGGNVTVDGNVNTLSLTGECQNVEINGNENTVRIEAAAAISVAGNQNRVTWRRGVGSASPRISNLGTANSIARLAE